MVLAEYRMRKETGWEPSTLSQFTTETNFDVLDINNELYKYNSTEGGAILPRGTSLIGLDLRKTKIRPLYVPDPEYDDKLYSSVLRVTGTCYFTAFTIFDADISKPHTMTMIVIPRLLHSLTTNLQPLLEQTV